jgi:acetyl coenzyme A synthetase (ADP forming)-like protein
MAGTLDKIFKPKSIAVVGASTKEGTIGYVILNNLSRYNYKGKIYPINPKADSILSLKCYKSVLDVPGEIDQAIILVSRDLVKPSLEECGQKGIGGIVTITAGFKEIGGEGIAKEEELMETVRRYNMRMVGPNCYGIVNTDPAYSLNGTFSKLNPIFGKVAFLSQSGALGEVVLDYTNRLNLGISKFISIGNKADVSDIDVLNYWKDDPSTDVILLYLENIENADELIKISEEITRRKPMVAVKAGRTESGARAISSHTGVLAGGDTGTGAFFNKCGILRADSFEELFDAAMAFANQPLPKGDRIAVITNAGGPGVLATDAIESLGLKMARFEQGTIDFLRANLLPMAAVTNPIDVISSGGADAYGAAVQAALTDPNVDGLIVIFVPPILVDHKAILNTVIDKVEKYANGKTVLACLMGSPSGIAGTEDLIAHNIPVYTFPDGAARGMNAMWQYRQIREQPISKPIVFDVDHKCAKEIVDRAVASGRKHIMGTEALTILQVYGIGIAASAKIRTPSELDAALAKLNLPIVMKIDDPSVVHKTDQGGVILNIDSTEKAGEAFETLRRRFGEERGEIAGAMLQEMIVGGYETIIGMSRDLSVGALMMFGLGGVSVEIMKDVAFRIAPLTESEAAEMIKSVKGYRLLTGFRGTPAANIGLLEETILRLSQLAVDFPVIESFDVNPFIIKPDGETSAAVDARFVLRG